MLSELNSKLTSLMIAYGVTLKIHKKSNFDRNPLKISTQHKYMYYVSEKNIKIEILS